MVRITPAKVPKPIEIERFLGLNQSIGETEIKLGSAIVMNNFRLTQDYKPQKRDGHNSLIDFGNSKDVQGLWYGTIAAKNIMLIINDTNVYEYDMTAVTTTIAIADLITEGTVTIIGTITDAKTQIFWFESKLYFINGTDFKTYDGTTYANVVNGANTKIPTLAIETPPAGGGTDFEQINLVQVKRNQNFTGNNVATVYQIRESDLDVATTTVFVNGVAQVETTDYTVNRTTGQFTFTVAPGTDALVVIGWSKTIAGNSALVTNNKYFVLYGPGNNTNVFLFGNANHKNKRMRSGVLDATYYPEFSFTLIGSDEFFITDIVIQYDRQIIFKESKTFYSYSEYITALGGYEYPVLELNQTVGNIAPNGVQLVDNSPVSLQDNSLWKWDSTQINDERNATAISERIGESLKALDLSTAITFDYQSKKELWINIGSNVYIYNYKNDTFYIYTNIRGTIFLEIGGTVYYGANGTLEKFSGPNDNGVAITARIELGFTDFGVSELSKNSRVMWVAIKPSSRTSLTISYATNRFNSGSSREIKPIRYILFDWAYVDFGSFSFLTNRNPQVFQRKLRAKKYSYIKIIFENKELDESLAIIAMKLLAETQGFNK